MKKILAGIGFFFLFFMTSCTSTTIKAKLSNGEMVEAMNDHVSSVDGRDVVFQKEKNDTTWHLTDHSIYSVSENKPDTLVNGVGEPYILIRGKIFY
jgi:hypothetical protein